MSLSPKNPKNLKELLSKIAWFWILVLLICALTYFYTFVFINTNGIAFPGDKSHNWREDSEHFLNCQAFCSI